MDRIDTDDHVTIPLTTEDLPNVREILREATEDQDKETIGKDLDVHIVKFLYDTPNRVVQGIWFFVLLIGIVFCAYYIGTQVIHFRHNQTATKISILRQDKYDYPPIILCPARNWDLDKARSENLSLSAQVFALLHVRKPGHFRALMSAANISEGEVEFFEFARKKNFSTYADFFRWVAVDSEKFVLDDRSVKSRKFEKLLVSGAVYDDSMMPSRLCFRIDAKPYNPAGRTFDLTFGMPLGHGGFGTPVGFMAIKYDTRLVLQQEAIPLRDNRLTAIRLSATKYIKLPSPNCTSQTGTLADPYSKDHCLFRCYVSAVKACNKCLLPTPEVAIRWPGTDSSPICAYHTHPKLKVRCNSTSESLETCQSRCKKPCEYTVFQRTDSQTLLNATATQSDITNITLTIDYRVDQGMLVYEEVPTFTFDTLVSEVGGQMGLWVGASILFIFEMFFLFGQLICKKLRPEKSKAAKL